MGAGKTVELGGKEYTISPITMGRLQELQRDAVASYKRTILTTYADNLDLLGDVGEKLLREKLEQIAQYDVDDLPKKIAYDVSVIEINEAMQTKLTDLFTDDLADRDEKKEGEVNWSAMLAVALDQESITAAEVKEITGRGPTPVKIAYDAWWVTGSYEGMISLVRASIRQHHPEITKEEIKDWPMADLAHVAREVEAITAPAMGNI